MFFQRIKPPGLAHSAHRQEDFVIGSKEVAEETGAKIASLEHALFGHSDRNDSAQRIEDARTGNHPRRATRRRAAAIGYLQQSGASEQSHNHLGEGIAR